MVCQGHLAGQSKVIGGSYHLLINLYINRYWTIIGIMTKYVQFWNAQSGLWIILCRELAQTFQSDAILPSDSISLSLGLIESEPTVKCKPCSLRTEKRTKPMKLILEGEATNENVWQSAGSSIGCSQMLSPHKTHGVERNHAICFTVLKPIH